MTASKSPRILIARMSAIGDTILTLPVASALRAHFPDAYLAWVVEEKSSAMVVGHACLDEVLVLPRGWFTNPGRLLAARRVLRSGRFDTTLDCQGMTKSAFACRLSGARQRIGLRGEHGRELSPWLNNQLVTTQPPPRRRPVAGIALTAGNSATCRPMAAAHRRCVASADARGSRRDRTGRPYAVINPGATWNSKLWELDRFGRVAQYLGTRHRLPTLVVWGGGRERAAAEQIVAESGGHAIPAPPSTLIELAALIEGGRLFISADTGPLHMAVAVGTPSIGLYGATRREDCGPYGSPHVALQVEYQSGSHKERRRADNRAMRLITVDMVCAQCDAMLGPQGVEGVR